MYSDTMYSDLGLFWQYTTYIWNFRSYFLNKRPSSMGLSMHDSRFFKKLLELKKEKYHIKCDRCRILEIYDGCLNYYHSFKNAIVFWDLKDERTQCTENWKSLFEIIKKSLDSFNVFHYFSFMMGGIIKIVLYEAYKSYFQCKKRYLKNPFPLHQKRPSKEFGIIFEFRVRFSKVFIWC